MIAASIASGMALLGGLKELADEESSAPDAWRCLEVVREKREVITQDSWVRWACSVIRHRPEFSIQPRLPVSIRWVDGLPKILAGGVPFVPFNTALRHRGRREGLLPNPW